MVNPEVLTLEDLAMFDTLAEQDLARVGNVVLASGEGGPLTPAILEEGQFVGGTSGQENLVSFDQIRARHHRIAQLLASGLKPVTVGRLVGFSPSFISNLQTSPAFQELLAHYSKEVADQFTDFVQSASEFSQEVLDELRTRLQENPKDFSVNQLLESMKATADRSGNAPVAKSVNLNVNTDLGTKLAEARKRSLAAMNITPGPD